MKTKTFWWQKLNPFARRGANKRQEARLRQQRRCQMEPLEVRQLLSINLGSLPHQVVGDQDAGYSEAGSGWQNWTDGSAYQGNLRYHAAGDGTDAATFALTGLDPTKTYQFFASYNGDSSHASNAPFTVTDGTSVLNSVSLNEQSAPNQAVLDGVNYQSLGVFQTTTGTADISLSDLANGYVVANAICAVEVTPPTTVPSVVDNADPAYAESGGGWLGWTSTDNYQGDCRYAAAGTGDSTASWTFSSLDPTKTYQVYATWNGSGNHASNAPYTILDGTSSLATVRMNQQNTPSDATIDGWQWQSLGTYQAASGNLVVHLSNNANGDVVADAVRIVEVTPPATAPSVVDNSGAGYAETGSAWLSWSDPSLYQGNCRYAAAGTGQNTAKWTFNGLDPTKTYQVYATWNASGNHASNAPYTVLDGTNSLGTIRLNQQNLPNDAMIDNQAWESLGTYQAANGNLVVQLSDDANGDVVADAVRIVEVTPPATVPSVVDNSDAAFAESGSSWLGWSDPSLDNGGCRYAAAGTGQSTAQWTFSTLPAGEYQVYATWNASGNHADNAPFTIFDGATSLATVPANQQLAPADLTAGGQSWVSLGTYTVQNGRLVVSLSDNADGDVVADAVRLAVVDYRPTVLATPTVNVPQGTTNSSLNLATVFGNLNGPLSQLTFTVQSNSNAALVPQTWIAGQALEFAVASGQSGTSNVTIRATDAAGEYAEATIPIVVAPSPSLAAPTGLTATAVSAGEIDLSWTDPNSPAIGATFHIERATDTAFTQNLTALPAIAVNAASCSDMSVASGTTYYYRVWATDAAGNPSASITASASAPVATALPTGWSDSDIGLPATAGSARYSSGVYTIAGSGSDIWNNSDQFHFASQSTSGDQTLAVRVTSLGNTNSWAKAGVMLRDSTAAGSMYVDIVATSSNGVTMQWRNATGGTCASATIGGVVGPSSTSPVWLKLIKSGDNYAGYYSLNGTTWTQVGSACVAFSNGTYLAGLAVTSHNIWVTSTATFDNFGQTDTATACAPLPTGWTDADIGGPSPAGSVTCANGVYTLSGGGTDISSTADHFNFASQTVLDGQTMIACVTSLSSTDSWAKAGLMFRDSAATGAMYVGIFSTPGNGLSMQWRGSTGGGSSLASLGGVAAPSETSPVWLKLVRNAGVYTGYYSADGATWTQVGSASVSFSNAAYLAGLAVTSHNNGTGTTATFDNVSVVADLPPAWSDADVGSPATTGSASFADGAYDISGGGTDIANASDQFNFASQVVSGDQTLLARVTSQTNTSDSAKAGVMFRDSTAAGSMFVDLVATPSNGLLMQWRSSTGGTATAIAVAGVPAPSATSPVWLKLVRSGNTYVGYYSLDASAWTHVSTANVSFSNVGYLAGLAVCSQATDASSTATLDNVSVGPNSSATLPAPLADADIGSPAVPGSAQCIDGVYTISGSGSDIWNTSDQFNFVSQSAIGDQTLVARVTSQTNTSAWAKAGVMFRDSSAANSMFVNVLATPSSVSIQWRNSTGGWCAATSNTGVAGPSPSNPVWVKLVKSGSQYTGYYSLDGATWTRIGFTSLNFTNSGYLAGMAVCSQSTTAASAATLDNYSLTAATTGSLPSSWSDADIGPAAPTGSAGYVNNTFTLSGGGGDLWNNADQCNFAAQTASGDQTLITRVTALTATHGWAKAGVMFRDTAVGTATSAGAMNIALVVTPSNGVLLQWRTTTGGQSDKTVVSTSAATADSPIWLALVKIGSTYTGYWSSDGAAWKLVGSTTVNFSATTYLAGLCVSSHVAGAAATASFDRVTLSNSLPSGWTDAQVGSPLPATAASYAAGVYTVSGTGTDIWGTSDQFSFASQSTSGSQTLVARVTSQTDTDLWAKSGVMFRDSASANSMYVDVVVTPGNGVSVQWRSSTGGQASLSTVSGVPTPSLANPVWVKLVKNGGNFTGYYSLDGSTWTQVGTVSVGFGNSSYLAGLCVSSHAAGTVSTVTFDNVAVAPSAFDNLALNAPVTASSTDSASAAANADDGNAATNWTSGSSTGTEWLQVDLGASYPISEVQLNWGAAYASAYEVQVSNDAQNWTTLYSTTAGTGGVQDLSGLAGSGRYVRLSLTAGPQANYALNDFAVYPLTLTFAGSNGAWGSGAADWIGPNGQLQTWQDGADAVFAASGSSTISIFGSVSPHAIAVTGGNVVLQPAADPAGDRIVLPASGATVNVEVASSTVTINSPLVGGSAAARVTFCGPGKLVLGAASTYAGETLIAGGIVRLGTANALPTTTVVQIGDPVLGRAMLDLKGCNQALAGLLTGAESAAHNTLWDSVGNSSTTPITLTIDNSGDFDFEGVFTGRLSLSKYGTGTLTLGGNSTNGGNVLVYDGKLQINGSTTANVKTVADYGNPVIAGNGDPKYWVVRPQMYSGPTSGQNTGAMVLLNNADSVTVLAAGEPAAVMLAVAGYATNTTNWAQSTFYFGTSDNINAAYPSADLGNTDYDTIVQSDGSGDANIPATGAFLVDTAGNLAQDINSTKGSFNPQNPANTKNTDTNPVSSADANPEGGFFNLDDQYFDSDTGTWQYYYPGITANSQLIVFEDATGEQGNDTDYDDVYWVVNVTKITPSGSLAIDADNNSTSGDIDNQLPEKTRKDQSPGKYIAVQRPFLLQSSTLSAAPQTVVDPQTDKPAADPKTVFVPMQVTLTDYVSGVTKIEFTGDSSLGLWMNQEPDSVTANGVVGSENTLIPLGTPITVFDTPSGSQDGFVKNGGVWKFYTSSGTTTPTQIYVQAFAAGSPKVQLQIDPDGDGNFGQVDEVQFTADNENVTCLQCILNSTVSSAGTYWNTYDPISGETVDSGITEGSGGSGTTFGQQEVLVLTGNGVAVRQNDKVEIWDYVIKDGVSKLIARDPATQGTMEPQGSSFVETFDDESQIYFQSPASVATLAPNDFGLTTEKIDAYSHKTDFYYDPATDQLLSEIATVGEGPLQEWVGYSVGGSGVSGEEVSYGYANTDSLGGIAIPGYDHHFWHTTQMVGSASFQNDHAGHLGLVTNYGVSARPTGGTYYHRDAAGRIQYTLSGDSLAQALAANGLTLGSSGLVDALDNLDLSTYADDAVTYDATTGLVASKKSGGVTTTYKNFTNPNNPADGINVWSKEQVETQSTGDTTTTTTTFYNYEGDVLLADVLGVSNGQWGRQITYNVYNSNGNVIYTYHPSAIDTSVLDYVDSLNNNYSEFGYNSSYDNLNVQLNQHSGLVDVNTYYSTTTATSTQSGGVAGWIHETAVAQGSLQAAMPIGSVSGPILQSCTDYIASPLTTNQYFTCHSATYSGASAGIVVDDSQTSPPNTSFTTTSSGNYTWSQVPNASAVNGEYIHVHGSGGTVRATAVWTIGGLVRGMDYQVFVNLIAGSNTGTYTVNNGTNTVSFTPTAQGGWRSLGWFTPSSDTLTITLQNMGGGLSYVGADAVSVQASITTHNYQFLSGTSAIASETTIQPVVFAMQHGSDTAAQSTDVYDSFGRVVWSKDAAGSISYTAYDAATGAVIEEIKDVNFINDPNPPAGVTSSDYLLLKNQGWTLPASGKNLVTQYVPDSQGRTLLEIDPSGDATATVYDDVNHITRTYSGWDSTSSTTGHSVVGTVQMSQSDLSGQYSSTDSTPTSYNQTLSYSVPSGSLNAVKITYNNIDYYLPAGNDSPGSGGSVIQSLSRTIFNNAGQVTKSLEYVSLVGVSYSTGTAALGQKGVNYLETDTYYDALGRVISTHNPDGTVEETVYDAQGNVMQQWKGNNDVPTANLNGDGAIDPRDFQWWVVHNSSATAATAYGMNMYLVTANTYAIDGGTLSTTAYVDANPADNRTTYYVYDSRDRQIMAVNPPDAQGRVTYTMTHYDDANEAIESQQYVDFFSGLLLTNAINHAQGEVVPAPLSSYNSSLSQDVLLAQTTTAYDSLGRVYESRTYNVAPTTSTTPAPGTVGDYLPSDTWYDSRGNVAAIRTGGGPIQKSAYDSAGELVASYLCADDSPDLSYSGMTSIQGGTLHPDKVVQQTQIWYDRDGRTIASATYERLPGDTATIGALTALNSYVTAATTFYDTAGRDIEDVNYGRVDVIGQSSDTAFFQHASGNLLVGLDGNPSVAEGSLPTRQTTLPNTYLVTKTAYNDTSASGPIIDATDNAGVVTETQSDLMGRTVRTIQNYVAAGLSGGLPVAADTAEDVTNGYQYDYSGRMVATIAYDANGSTVVPETTKYLYTSTIDPSLRTIVIEPDSSDNVSLGSDGDWTMPSTSDHTTTTYDLLGEALTSTDQRGVTHAYAYDSAGRQISDTVTNFGSVPAAGQTVNEIDTSYTDLGQVYQTTSYGLVSGARTVRNQIQNAYDGWGNLIRQWQAVSGQVDTSSTPSVQYSYDDGASGNAAQYLRLSNLTYPNGRKLDYNYAAGVDAIMSRLSNIADDNGGQQLAAYTYLGADTVAGESYPEAQISLDYSANNFAAWDRFGRVQQQYWSSYGSNSGGSLGTPTTLDGYAYTYDAAGNRLTQNNATAAPSLNETYTYDKLNRLTTASRGNESWTMDSLGNLIGNNGTAETVDPANEITTINGSAATSGYDAAGNMTTTPNPGSGSAALTCVYDAWNRLVSVTEGGTVSETLYYDGLGRLVRTWSYSTSGSETQSIWDYNLYSGQLVVQQTQSVLQTIGFLPAANSYVRQYVYSPGGKTPILSDSTAGDRPGGYAGRLYYLADANSNVTAVAGYYATGTPWQVNERYAYDPYGTVTVYGPTWNFRGTSLSASTVGNTVGFASMVFDPTTGLYYDEARWYSTATSDFISRDPALADLNTYRYCTNDPTDATDPSGNASSCHVAVAVWDSEDKGQKRSTPTHWEAGADNFEVSAKALAGDYAFPVSGTVENAMQQAIDVVKRVRQEGKCVDRLYISSHGYTSTYTQKLGDDEIDPKLPALKALGKELDADGAIYLLGCGVGRGEKGEENVKQYAASAGRIVVASRSGVVSEPTWLKYGKWTFGVAGLAWFSNEPLSSRGSWLVATPDGRTATINSWHYFAAPPALKEVLDAVGR